MKLVTDPNFDAKAFVAAGYDQVAQALWEAKCAEPPAWLPVLTDRLPKQARVLDPGCGCGVPIASTLAAQHRVTGIDISGEQIKLARDLVSNATFIHGDVTGMTFEPGSFDA
ncbi:MAG: class I SAM-dependent methyltransferase, partial [Alphaproteobacteria bacterium]|nr:class I SAM-dependent methyltransferase [Alphaproteobacteria bacterium]